MTTAAPALEGAGPRRLAMPGARRLHGERLARGAATAAVALLPLGVPSGPANTAPIDLFVALAIGAAALWATASGHRWRFPYIVPVALGIVGGAVGATVGPVPGTGAIALVQDVVLLVWCWALMNVCSSPATLTRVARTWAYAAIVWALLMFIGLAAGIHALSGQTARQGARAQLTLADPSYAANYFFISMMIVWATQCPRRRGFRLVAYGMLLAGIAFTGSNSGALSVITGATVAGVAGTYRRYGISPAVAVLAAVILAGYFISTNVSLTAIQDRASTSRYSFIRDGIGRGTSVEQRGMLLSESLRLYRAGSPLGEGPVSTKPRLRAEMAPFEKEAHDDYMAALLERGVIGFFAIFLLVAGLLARALSVAREPLVAAFSSAIPRPNALFGAVAGSLVAGTVYELLHVRHVWALFALLAAMYTWGRDPG